MPRRIGDLAHALQDNYLSKVCLKMIQSINTSCSVHAFRAAVLLLSALAILFGACSGAEKGAGSAAPQAEVGLASDTATDQPEEGDSTGKASPDSRTALVVTTLYPLEYFASRIGGDSVKVVNLISNGVEAHDFEPSPGDMQKLDAADLIIFNGSDFEPWMVRAIDAIGKEGRAVLEASFGLTDNGVERHDGDRIDPHVWLDPLIAVEQARLVKNGLSYTTPALGEVYAEHADTLIRELEELDQQFHSGLADCRLREFVTSHDAFGYLARRYGLETIPISGLSPEAQPSPRDLARLTDTIRGLGIKYVMTESVVNPSLARTLADEVGAELLTLHPLESLTNDQSNHGENYFSLMNNNLRSLRTALECR